MASTLEDISDQLRRLAVSESDTKFIREQNLGRGAYGIVFKARYRGHVCAAKEIHAILIKEAHTPVERRTLQDNFIRECDHCSKLNHPNIVRFIGVYHPPQQLLPVMIMELMDESLTAYAEKRNIQFKYRISILHDVAKGLSYLHSHNPPVIHRDLSPNNILLKLIFTGLRVAKIADLGVAKAINIGDTKSKQYLTKAPGTVDFMPPEALGDKPRYDTSLDVFSYGGIMLHTVNGKWPEPTPLTEYDPTTHQLQVKGLSEVERRQEYLDMMTGKAEVLRPLVEACLHNNPVKRPSIFELSEKIEETLEMIQRDNAPQTTKKPHTPVPPVRPPQRPPHKYLPFHPTLLVLPTSTDPFHLCSLHDDSQGLAALKNCYPILIDNLPSNHLTSLVRLQDVAIIPEAIVDIIVPSSSAEIGNKMIINYLIGLIHTEEHIITFCYFAERMIGEFDKCICVLKLKNTIIAAINPKENNVTVVNSASGHCVTASTSNNSVSLTANSTDVVEPDQNRANAYFGEASITSIVKSTKNSDCGQPYLDSLCSVTMVGFKQAVIIVTNGDEHSEKIKAVPLEVPPYSSTDESCAATSYTREDIDLLKSYFKKDTNTELSFSLHDGQNTQRSKNYYFECLEILFKECTAAGVTLYYTGYGEEGTGNWCFKDGVISFQDIFALYIKYCKGKLLYIFADCCYSGQWVLDCAKCMDEMSIGACGHQTREQGVLLKIYTSCYPNQKAALDCYIPEGFDFNEDHSNICINVKQMISDSQTTYGYDFTKIRCLQLEGPMAPCRLPDIPVKCSWKWEDLVAIDSNKRPSSLVYTVRGTDRGWDAWHIVLIERELLDAFREKLSTGNVDVADYGYVIKSGWGKDPPDDILDKIEKYT